MYQNYLLTSYYPKIDLKIIADYQLILYNYKYILLIVSIIIINNIYCKRIINY